MPLGPDDASIAGLAVRVLVALAFVASAAGQLRELTAFTGVVANYRILPSPLAGAFGRATPWLLLAAAAACLARPLFGAPMAAALLVLFAAAMAVNLRRGRTDIDCGCHQGAQKQTLRWVLVGRNLVLAAGLLLAAFLPEARGVVPVALGFGAGAAGFALYLAANALWALGAPPPRRTISIAKVNP